MVRRAPAAWVPVVLLLAACGGGSGDAADRAEAPLGPPCQVRLRCASSIVNDPKVDCAMEVADGTGAAVYASRAGVELRGRSSLEFPKKNYAVELRTETGAENPQNLLGMGQEADWVLDGSWVDRSFVRNDLVFASFRAIGHYAPKSRYCSLELNGRYEGLYRLSEKIKRDDDRVTLAEDDGTGKSFLLKQDEDGVLRFDLGAEDEWELVYPKQEQATAAQRAGAQAWLDDLRRALERSAGAPSLASLLDLANTVDWILVEEFAKNIDAFNLSVHLARNAGRPAEFVPWDLDLAFGQPTLARVTNESPEGWIHGRTRFISNLIANAELRAELAPRWLELREGPLSDAAVVARLDWLAAGLPAAAVTANFARWPIAEVDFQQIYEPYTLYRVGSHAEEMTKLRDWVQKRLLWIDAHIAAYPN